MKRCAQAVIAIFLLAALAVWLRSRHLDRDRPRPARTPRTETPRTETVRTSSPTTAAPPEKSRDARSEVRRLLAEFDADPGVLNTYDSWGSNVHLDGTLLLPRKYLAVAAFSDLAFEYYRELLADPAASWPRKLAAIDGLSILARGHDERVRRLFLGLIERPQPEQVREWLAAALGRYYHDAEVRAALQRQAEAGSEQAWQGLSYYPDVVAEAAPPLVRERVELLRSPGARAALKELIQGTRKLSQGDTDENRVWAAECAARWAFTELAPAIREALPQTRPKVLGAAPDEWITTEGRNAVLADLVRALARLCELTDEERRYAEHNVIFGDAASAAAALRTRYPELAELLQPR